VAVALYVLGLLIFLVGIGVSIGLHEIGHLLPAKRFGVKVTQYMVGFGPTLWSKRTSETEYGIKAIPVGGYIRMIGMYPPAKDADPMMLRASTTGRFKTLVDDARQQSLEEISPEDADRVFYKLPVRQRIVVMLGGPTMNLLLAFVLFTLALSVLGTPGLTTTVGRVVECVPTTANVKGATNSDGTCTYTPNPNFYATDSLDNTLVDGYGAEACATVRVTVSAVDDTPTAVADSFSVSEDVTLTGSLSTNDTVGGDRKSGV